MCVFVSVHMCACLHTCVAHISPTWGGVGELFLVVTANVIKELVFHKCHHKSTQRAIVPAAGGTEEEDKGEKGRLQLPDECLQCILYRPQQTDDNHSGFSCGNHQPKVFFEIPLYCTMVFQRKPLVGDFHKRTLSDATQLDKLLQQDNN